MLENYKGTIELNGKTVEKLDLSKVQGSICIKLTPEGFISKPLVSSTISHTPQLIVETDKEYRINVRACMLKKASPEFDFMAKWNNDNPMPLRTMVGKKIKETRGMEYWELHGDTVGKIMCTCLKCGRRLDNPISQYFGLGPECGGHNYVSPFESEEELENAVKTYRENVLQRIKWSGWIIKSWILEREEVD